MIVGTANVSGVNIRTQPKVVSGNIVGLLKYNSSFTGSVLVNETETRQWIKLLTIDGGSVGQNYIAAWCVDYKEVADVPVGDDPIVSGTLTLASGKIVKMVVVND